MRLIELLEKYDYDCNAEEIQNYLQHSPLNESSNWIDDNSVTILPTKEIKNRIYQLNYYYDNEAFILKRGDIVFIFNYSYIREKYNVDWVEMCLHIERNFLNLGEVFDCEDSKNTDILLLVIRKGSLFTLHLTSENLMITGLLMYSSNEQDECWNLDQDKECYDKLLNIIANK